MAFIRVNILNKDLEISTVRVHCFEYNYSCINFFFISVKREGRRWLSRAGETCSILVYYNTVLCMDGLSYCYILHYHNGDDTHQGYIICSFKTIVNV